MLARLLLAFAPLLLTVAFTWLTMEAYLNFGSGEKDILLSIPLLLWSLVYLCASLVLWWLRTALRRSALLAAGWATGLVASAWVVLFTFVLLRTD